MPPSALSAVLPFLGWFGTVGSRHRLGPLLLRWFPSLLRLVLRCLQFQSPLGYLPLLMSRAAADAPLVMIRVLLSRVPLMLLPQLMWMLMRTLPLILPMLPIVAAGAACC